LAILVVTITLCIENHYVAFPEETQTGDAAISGKASAGFTSTTVSNRQEQ
jgi:hypothetical protein